MSPKKYDLSEIKRVDATSNIELRLRFVLLSVGAAIFSMAQGTFLYLGLLSIYAFAVLVHLIVVRRAAVMASTADLIPVLCTSFFVTGTYVGMMVVLWEFPEPATDVVSLLMLVCMMLNTTAIRAAEPLLRVIDLLGVWATMSWFTFGAARSEQYGNDLWLFGGAAVLALAYFAYTIREVADARNALSKAQKESIISERNAAVGQVAGGVAHDFNNIISVIANSLELAKETRDQQEQARLINVAVSATDHAANVTRQLMAMGRTAPLLPRSFSLNDATEEFKVLAQSVLPAQIRLAVDRHARNVRVHADYGMLQSALLNIAINSKHALPDGGTLTITYGEVGDNHSHAAMELPEGKFAFIALKDNGVGMHPAVADQAFEPYFSTREVGSGSGLGLSMVKGFAEQSKGTVRLQSVLGEGTEITLFLPLALDTVDSVPDTPKAVPVGFAPSSPKPVLLIAEDNQQLQQLLALKLKSEGYKVHAFSTGDEALEFLKDAEKVDLVLTDQVMPGDTQGTDLLEYVKRYMPFVPVIIMSGHADLKNNSDISLIEADRFIEKPLSLQELSHVIQGLIANGED